MRRFLATNLFLILALIVLLAFSACGGSKKSSDSNSGVTQIAITPLTYALDQGATVQVTATPQDANGTQITKVTPSYSVPSGQNLISVSVAGLVCAGQWDSLTTPVICTPSTATGEAIVTVAVGTITAQSKVVVLPRIDHLSITPITPDPAIPADPTGLECISQLAKRTYTLSASYKGAPVVLTDAVKDAAVVWNINNNLVGSVTPQTTTDSSNNTITDTRFGVVTAKVPGKTQVIATLGTHQSLPAEFITCPVSKILIADSATPPTSLPLAAQGSVTLTPTIIDSRGNPVLQTTTDTSGLSTSQFSLTWNVSQPLAAGLSTPGVITSNSSSGTSSVSASCTPPSCNVGLGSIYSNVFVIPVSATSTNTTVYVGSSDATAGKTLLPVTTVDNKVGTAITLGDVPNSMMTGDNGVSVYIGTASGLIIFTPGDPVPAPLASAPGKVIAVAPGATTVLVSDGSHLYAVTPSTSSTTTSAVQTINFIGATAASFAPDGSKAYVVGNGHFAVYTLSNYPASQTLSGATDAGFVGTGAFGYIADASGLNVYATCNDMNNLIPFGGGAPVPTSVSLSPAPAFVSKLPDGLHLVTAASPNMNLISVNTDNRGFLTPATGCAPSISNSSISAVLNGGTAFNPKQLIVTSDGKYAFVVSDAGSLIGASIDSTNGTITPVSISLQTSVNGTAQPASIKQNGGGITLDGKLVFLTGDDNQLHRIDLSSSTPTDTPIPLTGAPSGFTADFMLVMPR